MKFLAFSILLSAATLAQNNNGYGYLSSEDQPYFKNQAMDGMNKQERIDANVKEINKLHSEVARLKTEMAALRSEIEALKNKK